MESSVHGVPHGSHKSHHSSRASIKKSSTHLSLKAPSRASHVSKNSHSSQASALIVQLMQAKADAAAAQEMGKREEKLQAQLESLKPECQVKEKAAQGGKSRKGN